MMRNASPKSPLEAEGRRGPWHWIPPLIAVVFGLMTVLEGGTVLFGAEEARRAAGRYVPFVLWFNFLAGFAYVAAGIGLWKRVRWSVGLSFGILAGTAAVFLAFGAHVFSGGPYENRTLVAMTLRTIVWLAIALWAHRRFGRVGTERADAAEDRRPGSSGGSRS